MNNIFWVQRFSAELCSELLGEENKSRKSLNEENMSILYEEPCDNLFIVNIFFFICKRSYDVKDIDVTKNVVAIITFPFVSIISRSSHSRFSMTKVVLENFIKFTGKHLRPATLLKERLWHRCFPVNSAKFLRTPYLQNTFWKYWNI